MLDSYGEQIEIEEFIYIPPILLSDETLSMKNPNLSFPPTYI